MYKYADAQNAKNVCKIIFCLLDKPSELFDFILRKSSKKPTEPKLIVTNKTTHIYLFPRSPQSNVEITKESRNVKNL